MTDSNDPRPSELDSDFAALRQATPPTSPMFLEQVMADALAEMPTAALVRRPRPGRRWGGWQSIVTLGGAALAGLTVGYLDPASVSTVAGDALLSFQGTETVFEDPFTGFLLESDL
ncbi:MAG: hypothetical protein AAGB10_07630 [Pseudomonadota bacterium]